MSYEIKTSNQKTIITKKEKVIHVSLEKSTTHRRFVLLNVIHMENIFPGQVNILSKIAANADLMPCKNHIEKASPTISALQSEPRNYL